MGSFSPFATPPGETTGPWRVAAFYRFFELDDLEAAKAELESVAAEHPVVGTVLVAHEGINGTIAGRPEPFEGFVRALEARFSPLSIKYASAEEKPFHRFKVRPKKEIVTIGLPEVRPVERVGTYVPPEEWNQLLEDPDVVVVDTRNAYEVRIGTFERALDPETASFREFPEWAKTHLADAKDKTIAMFCTGGIRCEKATAHLLAEGFSDVRHLQGGILRYLEDMPEAESKWRGEGFVFDHRVAVTHGLEQGAHGMCYGCREPVSPEDMAAPGWEEGVSCPRCVESLSEDKKAAARERMKQIRLKAAQGLSHFGSGT